MTARLTARWMTAAVAALALAGPAWAATEGTDDASAPAYKDGWAEGGGGGGAFGGWHLTVRPDGAAGAGFFVGDSTRLGGPGPDVDTASKAFGLYGKNPNGTVNEAAAYRDFNGGGLTAGQTFAVDLAVNFRNGIKGLDVRGGTAGAGDRPTLFTFAVAGDDYAVSNAAAGNGSTRWAFKTNVPIHLKLTQTTPAGGTWTLTRGTDPAVAGTYAGVASGLKLFCGGTDGTDADNLYANRLSIGH